MLDKIKALMDMQKKMQEIKKELDNTVFEVESPDGLVKIKMNGSQDMKEITIEKELSQIDKDVLQKSIKEGYNKAVKQSHEIAARKMKDITGLNLPGMP